MSRWSFLKFAAAASVLLLGGCATYYPTYSDGSYPAARSSVYVGGSSYYAPSASGYGDYYHGRSAVGGSVGLGVDFYSYPAYFSLFWPVNRWFHDPYWHPGYYYGVTYYPRNYFSYSYFGYGGYGPYAHWYSPYRYSWVDSYYAWDRWPRHHSYYNNPRFYPRHAYGHSTPRFGHARNLAEREARARGIGNQQYRGRGLAGGVDRGGRAASRVADFNGRASSRTRSDARSVGAQRAVAPSRAAGGSRSAPLRGGIERGASPQRGASLRGANVRGASLRGADTRGMDVTRNAALSRSSYRNAPGARGEGERRSYASVRGDVRDGYSASRRGGAVERGSERAGRSPAFDMRAGRGGQDAASMRSREAGVPMPRDYSQRSAPAARGGNATSGFPASRYAPGNRSSMSREASPSFAPSPRGVQPATSGGAPAARYSAPTRSAPTQRSRGGSRSRGER